MRKTYLYNNHVCVDLTLHDGDTVRIIDERGHEEDWFSEVQGGSVTLPTGEVITLDDLQYSEYDIDEVYEG